METLKKIEKEMEESGGEKERLFSAVEKKERQTRREVMMGSKYHTWHKLYGLIEATVIKTTSDSGPRIRGPGKDCVIFIWERDEGEDFFGWKK